MGGRLRRQRVLALAGALALGGIIADVFLPWGTVAGLAYFAAVICAGRIRQVDVIWATASICTVFLALGLMSGAADTALLDRLATRAGSIGLLWVAAALTVQHAKDLDLLGERETRLQAALTRAPLIMWTVDHNLIITSSEGRGLFAVGLEPGEQVGRKLEDTVRETPTFDETMTAHRNVLEQGESQAYVGSFGGRHITVHLQPMHGMDGAITGVLGIGLDVTEAQQAAVDRTLSEERYRTLVDHAPLGILEMDLDGTLLSVSPAGRAIHGLTDDDVIGRSYPTLVETKYQAPLARAIDAATRGEASDVEFRLPASEQDRVRRVHLVPLPDEHGMPERLMAMVQDVTEQRNTEDRLRWERELFAGGPVVVFRWINAPGWPVEYVSPNVATVFGHSDEDFLSQRVSYAASIHPDDLERVGEEVAQHSADGVRWFEQDYRVIRPDGVVVWLYDFTVVIRNTQGDITHYEGYVLDITARKEAEQALRMSEDRYRVLFEHAPESVVVLDCTTGRFIEWNANALRLFGRSIEEMRRIGPVESSPVHQPDGRLSSDVAQERLTEALDGEYPVFEWMHLHPDGSEVPCEIRLARMPDTTRPLVRGSITDIRERKRVEARQQLLMAELDHRVKNNLAAVVSLALFSMESAKTLGQFKDGFIERISAMATTHEELARTHWSGVSLDEAIQMTLAAYREGDEPRVRFHGPRVVLRPEAAMPLCLALHELATNAVKYGALSGDQGYVEIRWTMAADVIDVRWSEHDGPTVVAPKSQGLGTVLIEGFIKHEMLGGVEMDYDPAGFRCSITVPMSAATSSTGVTTTTQDLV